MAKIKTLLFSVALTLAPLLTIAQTESRKITLPECDLKNLYMIAPGVYRSDQPNSKDFAALEKFGIREVLSLRYWHVDTNKAKETSLTLHTLHTKASTIDMTEIIEALRIIHQRQGPILIHCWHGSDRTGAVCAMYRIIFNGWSKQKAIDEMLNGGFGFHKQFNQIIDVINNADIDQIKIDIGLIQAAFEQIA